MFASAADYSRGGPLVQAKWGGQDTLGMLQMYVETRKAPPYPDGYGSAGDSDVQFAKLFQRVELLPFIPVHMGSRFYDTTRWEGKVNVTEGFEWAYAPFVPDGACPCCHPN